MRIDIPENHPRAESLKIRERLVEGFDNGVVASAGLIAHGRGEAFDYILGEKTVKPAITAIRAAGALLLTSKSPVISVNGNAAALAAKEIVLLSESVNAKIEVNLFYRTVEREKAIEHLLRRAGAKTVLGVNETASAVIPEIGSERRHVDRHGILTADAVMVPLEDGDRTEALASIGKKVIAIDLNPLSRTSQHASITIVDNIVRAMPLLIETAERLLKKSRHELKDIVEQFDNKKNLGKCISIIEERLHELAAKGRIVELEGVEEHGI